MIFSNWKKKLVLLLFLLSTTSLLPTSSSLPEVNAIPQEVIDQHNNFLENYLQQILAQFRAIDSILEDLALLTNQNQISGIKNKRVIIDEIKALRGIIESIQKDSYAHLEPSHIYILTKLLDGMLDHITKSISKGFVSLGAFDMEAVMNRVYRQPINPDNFEKDIAATKTKIETIAKSSQGVGLHWYNKIYRRVDDYVIQPSIKYRVPQRTGKGLLAASVAFMVWFYTDRGTPEKALTTLTKRDESNVPIPYIEPLPENQSRYYDAEYRLRSFVGPHAHIMGSSEVLTSFHDPLENKLKSLGSFDYYLRKYNSGLMPLGGVLLAFGPSVFNDEISNASGWIRKKALQFHNFMRGGAYNKKEETQQEADNLVQMDPKITFNDIIGLDHAKEVLSLIIKYIEDPERWDRAGLRPEKGYLLTGPTRTGKSYIAEALAGEIKKLFKNQNRNPDDFGFYSISASFILQNGITKILESAKAVAPCVLFIDEIDLLGLQRVANKELLNEFLIAMSGAMNADPKKQVILLAATNKPQNMDDALKQPGRFGKEIPFEYPSSKYRKEYFMRRLSALAVNTDALDIDKLTYETQGCSFEELNTIIKKAFQVSKMQGRSLSQESLEQALDTEIRRIILNDQKVLSEKERELIAIHQAGQAFIGSTYNTGFTLTKVTMLPVAPKKREEAVWDEMYKDDDKKQKAIETGKIFMLFNQDALVVSRHEEKLHLCKMYLAGHIATELLLHVSGHDYRDQDRQSAFNLAKKIIFNGIDIKDLPRKHQTELHDKAFNVLKQCTEQVSLIIKENEDKIRKLASFLSERKSLTADEVKSIIATGSLPVVQAAKSSTLSMLQNAVNASAVEKELGFKEERPKVQHSAAAAA